MRILIFLTLLFPFYIKPQPMTEVTFFSMPGGADIILDGVLIGRSSLRVDLAPGDYQVKFVLPGFQTKEFSLVVDAHTKFVGEVLETGEHITKIERELTRPSEMWDADDIFYTYQVIVDGLSTHRVISAFDAVTETAYPQAAHPYLVNDPMLRERLFISPYAQAYSSPSGRYIVFYTLHQGRWGLYAKPVIYNTQTDQLIKPEVTIGYFHDNVLLWSPNETALFISSTCEGSGGYLIMTESGMINFQSTFVTENGQQLFSEFGRGFFDAAPTDDGSILTWATLGDGYEYGLWMVKDGIGRQIPVEGYVTGAAFSPDGRYIYFGHDPGISRVQVQNLEEVEIVSDEISSRWGIRQIIFSPSLNYVYIHSEGDGDWSGDWIYEMPR